MGYLGLLSIQCPDIVGLSSLIRLARHVQVLNDLLDPSRSNLKLREDPKRGFYVEGIKEETLVSAEHALSVIATGVAHRKVHIIPSAMCLCLCALVYPSIVHVHILQIYEVHGRPVLSFCCISYPIGK